MYKRTILLFFLIRYCEPFQCQLIIIIIIIVMLLLLLLLLLLVCLYFNKLIFAAVLYWIWYLCTKQLYVVYKIKNLFVEYILHCR